MEAYKDHVREEIAQEAAVAGMTVEEYAANGYEPREQPIDAPEQPETPAVKYYPINEGAARRANDANSYRDYAAGSATAEYRQMVNQAAELAQRQNRLSLSLAAAISLWRRNTSRTQPVTAICRNGRMCRVFLIKSAVRVWAVSARTTHKPFRSWKANLRTWSNRRKA